MKVIVTGGSGHVGKHVLKLLLEYGHSVTNVDRVPTDFVNCPFKRVDLLDLGQVCATFAGAEAICHLAAIPHPLRDPHQVVFQNNMMSTYNVLQAAALLGIGRVVYAGSESALGFPFTPRPFPPEYLPIDEAHPLNPRDAYGLSKKLCEDICKMFTLRHNIVTISLRLSYVQDAQTYEPWLRPILDDPASGAFNLWGYVDAYDVANAFRLALDVKDIMHAAFYIAADDCAAREPILDLVKRYVPEAATIRLRDGFGGFVSPLDTSAARRILGWKPEKQWRMYLS